MMAKIAAWLYTVVATGLIFFQLVNPGVNKPIAILPYPLEVLGLIYCRGIPVCTGTSLRHHVLALAAGAPWGDYAMGGAFPGQFPPTMRVAAVIQAALIVAMAAVVLARAGIFFTGWLRRTRWPIWVVVGYGVIGLIERLNAGLHRKLTLISAPAGFGKTTLVSEWIEEARDTKYKIQNELVVAKAIQNPKSDCLVVAGRRG